MNRKFLIILVILIVLTSGVVLLVKNIKTNQEGERGAVNENIIVDLPQKNEEVKSPLIIKGRAKGFWFFEASFPVKLADEQGNLIAQTIATAKSDWMTTDFVDFEATLDFSVPSANAGFLVLEKDNPSGLPENADQIKIPVKFNQTDAIIVKVFFNNEELDPEFSCNKVFPVERNVYKTEAIGRAALEELLKGPTDDEQNQGYFTSINPDVQIQSLNIKDDVATVDFNDQLEFQVGGSCRVAAIRSQITETLKQFPTVKKVIISINGRTEDILQP